MSTSMTAVVSTGYGSPNVLQLRQVDKPVPGDKEVLIKIHATTVEATDAIFRQGSTLLARRSPVSSSPDLQYPAASLPGRSKPSATL